MLVPVCDRMLQVWNIMGNMKAQTQGEHRIHKMISFGVT